MKNITCTLLLLGSLGIAANSYADEQASAIDNAVPQAEDATVSGPESAVVSELPGSDATNTVSEPSTMGLVEDAGQRRTPPWTNDKANINLQQPRPVAGTIRTIPYQPSDFSMKAEWEKLFADDDHFSTTSGKELYETMCQACHMADGQGARGAGDFPSFVGDKRLRSPYYPIDVILNGFRGMPAFSDMLSDQQVADVVNHLRTNFGNQLEANTTAEDVVRVRAPH